MDKKFQKIAVKAFIVRDNKVLLLQSGNKRGWWEFPGGKIEYGEDAEAALKREIKEELLIETFTNEGIIDCLSRIVDFGEAGQPYHIIYPIYKCSIPEDAVFTLSEEHINGGWFSEDEVRDLEMWEGYRKLVLENL